VERDAEAIAALESELERACDHCDELEAAAGRDRQALQTACEEAEAAAAQAARELDEAAAARAAAVAAATHEKESAAQAAAEAAAQAARGAADAEARRVAEAEAQSLAQQLAVARNYISQLTTRLAKDARGTPLPGAADAAGGITLAAGSSTEVALVDVAGLHRDLYLLVRACVRTLSSTFHPRRWLLKLVVCVYAVCAVCVRRVRRTWRWRPRA